MTHMEAFRIFASAILAIFIAEFLEPKIRTWLNITPEKEWQSKGVRYGVAGASAVGAYWGLSKVIKG